MVAKGNIVKHIIEDLKAQDSITIGTASKGGALKVYGNMNNVKEFQDKIDNAIQILNYANQKIEASRIARKVF